MFEFGKSYVVTLAEEIIMPDGRSKWAVFGDYKGAQALDGADDVFLLFGDTLLKAEHVRYAVQAEQCALGVIDIEYWHEGELRECRKRSPITSGHMFKKDKTHGTDS